MGVRVRGGPRKEKRTRDRTHIELGDILRRYGWSFDKAFEEIEESRQKLPLSYEPPEAERPDEVTWTAPFRHQFSLCFRTWRSVFSPICWVK